jgi:hypothetical protein
MKEHTEQLVSCFAGNISVDVVLLNFDDKHWLNRAISQCKFGNIYIVLSCSDSYADVHVRCKLPKKFSTYMYFLMVSCTNKSRAGGLQGITTLEQL